MKKTATFMPLERTACEALLSRNGIIPTHQRVEIARRLLAKNQHISAETLLEKVNSEQASVSKATVYNTLRLFAAQGLIKEVKVDRSKVLYDSNPSPHHHFYDMTTGELKDIALDEIEVRRLPMLPAGTLLKGVEVIIRVAQDS